VATQLPKKISKTFSMKCPSCDAKFKETKVTPWLLVLAVIVTPIFVFIGVTLQTYIAGFWPFIEKIPTAFVFLAFAYPIYAAYEKFNARIIVSKGILQLK
jgi:putative effector of murein hydrolase